jgi:hypothetical protein
MVASLEACNLKDLNSIITGALKNWANHNIIKCPVDKKYCNSKELYNNCSRATP